MHTFQSEGGVPTIAENDQPHQRLCRMSVWQDKEKGGNTILIPKQPKMKVICLHNELGTR